jgi:hypothetical protein
VATGKWDEILRAYRAAWDAGESPAADVEIVRRLRLYVEDDVRDFATARRTFANHIDTALERGWLGDDEDSAYVFACVLHPEQLDDRWLRTRNTLSATGRSTYVQQAVRAFCDVAGREAARVLVPRWWRECELE